MEDIDDDDAAMMAMMGVTGFGTTKVGISRICDLRPLTHLPNFQGKHVEGNQEGTVNIKKTRTWRQYMNRFVLSYLISTPTHVLLFPLFLQAWGLQ